MPVAKSAGKAVFGDVLGGVLGAPVFWYGQGLVDAAKYCGRLIARRWKTLGLGVWIVNIFVPMYAQRDIAGTLISVAMRLFQIIVRGIAMVLWTALVIVLFAAYVAIPILIAVELVRELAGAFGL
jgi:hypothetical protein